MKFRIFDWAGNDKTEYYGEFNSFEDAWDAVRAEFPDDEEAWGEFYVAIVDDDGNPILTESGGAK